MALIAAASIANAALASSDKCYALAFSAGEETSAYQAGVLTGFLDVNSADLHAYSAITGMSGGAVNAAILASYAEGDEKAAATRMVEFWLHASEGSLYKDWIGGVAEGVTLKDGLYNNEGLKTFLEDELTDIGLMQRFVDVGLTDALSGFYVDNLAEDLNSNL